MKKSFTPIAMLAVLGVAAVLLFGCEGPQGPAGKDGKDGNVATMEGFAPNIQCGKCHTQDIDTVYNLEARRYQWERSKHGLGPDFERNGRDCAGCHTTQGFIQRAKRGTPQPQSVTDVANPSPPGCFACHSPHLNADFRLRATAPVTIYSYVAGVPDAVFDYGKGNMCVWCHQTRTTSPMNPRMPANPAPTDTLTITSSRWYPHYGVQGQMLMGTGGFQFPGYTYRGNSNHTTNATIQQEGCIECHMAEPIFPTLGTGRAGGHSMNIRYSTTGTDTLFMLVGCNQSGCHGANLFTKTTILAAQKPVTDSLSVLKTLLIQRGWLTTSGTVNASSTRPLRITPAVKAGALFNYFFVEHDLSRGIHNTKYAQDLVNSSLQALRTP